MKTTKSCPKCRETLSIDARACECGWTLKTMPKDVPERPHIQCAHELCPDPAICKIKTPTGWAKLCLKHYEAHFQAQGKAAHTAMGLDRWPDESAKDHRKRVFEYWRLLSRKAPMNLSPESFDEAA